MAGGISVIPQVHYPVINISSETLRDALKLPSALASQGNDARGVDVEAHTGGGGGNKKKGGEEKNFSYN